jgi:DNA-binding SARP family transcriptional activator
VAFVVQCRQTWCCWPTDASWFGTRKIPKAWLFLRVRLFGGLTLIWDDAPLPAIPGSINRSLLVYLLTYRHRPHAPDLLAVTFWPKNPEAAARRRLGQASWRIRHSLPPRPIVLADGHSLRLNPDLPWRIGAEEFDWHQAQCTR